MRKTAFMWLRTAMVAMALCVTSAHAFVVNSYVSGGQTLYLKWGTDNHAGTPGGIVYWSFIPAGTSGSAYCGTACPGTSVDSIEMEISPGGGFALKKLSDLESEITVMMAQWAAYSGIQFVKIDPEKPSGIAINDAAAVPPATGQIRIGVFAFSDNSVAGVGYSPPPNGGTGAGDILLNANAYYQDYVLPEGSSFDTTHAPNDFQTLMLHELGHAVGLEHPPTNDGTCPVMYPYPPCYPIIKRQLEADDIAGVVFLYDDIFNNGFE
ncbi:MAG: matrixin family metalloprotease [Rudaea sp.]